MISSACSEAGSESEHQAPRTVALAEAHSQANGGSKAKGIWLQTLEHSYSMIRLCTSINNGFQSLLVKSIRAQLLSTAAAPGSLEFIFNPKGPEVICWVAQARLPATHCNQEQPLQATAAKLAGERDSHHR